MYYDVLLEQLSLATDENKPEQWFVVHLLLELWRKHQDDNAHVH